MREIKFRGKRVDNGEWIVGDLVQTKHFTYIINTSFIPAKSIPSEKFIEVDPKTVGQYTGLKDKEGNEIYEGDYIAHREFIPEAKLEIQIIDGCTCAENWDCVRTDLSLGYIIGNIHDNPELL